MVSLLYDTYCYLHKVPLPSAPQNPNLTVCLVKDVLNDKREIQGNYHLNFSFFVIGGSLWKQQQDLWIRKKLNYMM